MKKLFSALFAAFTAALVAFSGVSATAAGQIEGGDIYRADKTSATCNDVVTFTVRIHNPGPDRLNTVNVLATLPATVATSHTSTVTVSSPNAEPNSTSDSATVTVNPAASLSYIAGSTKQLNQSGVETNTLPDTITSTGVTVVGGVGVSINEKRFVKFSVKVSCPEVPKKITVCELATKKIITIDEKDFDASKHSKDLSKCKEVPPAKITVCELSTKKIIVIEEKDFDSAKHSKDLSKCKEVPPTKIKVCELSTKKVIEINEKDFDAAKHSKNLNDCKEVPVPGKIQVCETSTKTVITINEDEFDSAKHSKDLNECAEVLAEETPTELPATGPAGVVAQIIGASSLAGAIAAFVRSRKLLG